MELNVNDRVIGSPTADDVTRALASPPFPQGWFILLEKDDGAALDAQALPDGDFALTRFDPDDRRFKAISKLDAPRLAAILIDFLDDKLDWRKRCKWREEKSQASSATPTRSEKLTGRSGREPPTWAVIAVVATFGFVAIAGALDQWEPDSFLRSFIPIDNTTYFAIFMIALPMLALVIAAIVNMLVETRRAAGWTKTTARIVRSEVERRRQGVGDEDATFRDEPAIAYEFRLGDGQTVRGSRIGIGDDYGGANTSMTLARYPVGATVEVFYDPTDPRNCVLERGDARGLAPRGCLLWAGAFVAALLAILWTFRSGPDFVASHFPNATTDSKFTVILCVVGLILLIVSIGMRRNPHSAANWPSAPGRIVKSQVELDQDRKTIGLATARYRPAIEFAYMVNGRSLRSDQIALTRIRSGDRSAAEAWTGKYPLGAEVVVRHDPKNPASAVIEAPAGMAWYPLLLSLGCFALAAWRLGLFG